MIQYIQLITGDEIVADVEIFTPELIRMKHAARVVVAREGIGMMPYAPFAKKDVIEVSRNHVLFMTEAEDELRNAYNERFGSGIVFAPSGLQL